MPDSRIPELTELSVPSLDDQQEWVDVSDTADHATGSSRRATARRGLALLPCVPSGRLGLENDVYVSATDQTSKSTLYWNPAPQGGLMRLNDGTRWQLYAIDSPLSLNLSSLGLSSGKIYDVWGTLSGGSPALSLSAAWTNDLTRADAVARASGVLCKSGDASKILLGTIRTTSTTTTESSFTRTDAPARSFVWNLYNQIDRCAFVKDSIDSYNYTLATIRQKRGSANNQVEFVCGVPTPWSATDYAYSVNTGVTFRSNGVGFDTTTAFTGIIGGAAGPGGYGSQHVGGGEDIAAAGYHVIASLERSDAAGTSTWYGDVGAPTYFQTGLRAWLRY